MFQLNGLLEDYDLLNISTTEVNVECWLQTLVERKEIAEMAIIGSNKYESRKK